MNLIIYKRISVGFAIICLAMGSFYLFWNYKMGVNPPLSAAISFASSIAFLLIGSAVLSMFYETRLPLTRLIGLGLLLLSGIKWMHVLFYQNTILDTYLFFSRANLLNLAGFALLGTVFVTWKKESVSNTRYLYSFFISVVCFGLSIFGLIAYLLGFSNVYGDIHLFAMGTLMASSLGLFSALIYFEIERKVDLTRWVPWTVLLSLIIFVSLLAVGLYLDHQIAAEEFTSILMAYSLIGGIVFSLATSFLTYFWLLSRAQVRRMKEYEENLVAATKEESAVLEAAGVGVWKWDFKTGNVIWDSVMYGLFGMKHSQKEGSVKDFLERVHLDDRPLVQKSLDRALQGYAAHDMIFRIVWPDQSIHYIHGKGKVDFDENRTAIHMAGIAQDVTAEQYSAQLVRLSEGVARILGRSNSLDEATPLLLNLFHSVFGSQVCAVWRRKSISQPFECIKIEAREPQSIPQFLEATKTVRAGKADPFLESLDQNFQPIVVEDLGKSSKYVRSIIAEKEGIRGALVFPILEGTAFTGIIELFKKEPCAVRVDANLSNVLMSIGILIGEFIRKKEAETSAKEYAIIVSSSQEPIYSCLIDGTILSWNNAAERLFGWAKEEVIGKNIQLVYPPERYQELEMLKQQFRQGIANYRLKTQRKTKEGQLIWVENTYSSIPTAENENRKISVIVKNLQEERAAEEALRKAEEKYRDFVETTDEWIWEMDQKGIFTYSNPAAENTIGYAPKDILGFAVYFFIPEKSRPQIESDILTKTAWKRRLLIWKHKNGKERILESSSLPILNEKQEIVGFRGASRDVTDRETMQKTRNEFIALVSHEIRTPLTSIHGALGLLSAQTNLSPEAQDLIQLAYRNSALLSKLILDIIDVEKFELGKLEFHYEKVVLSKLIQEAVKTASLISENKHVQIVEGAAAPDVQVNVDSERLIQVILNLLSNAVKHSPQNGKVSVVTKVSGNKVRVEVQDEGPGVPPEFRERIFGRFEQAGLFSTTSSKGSGLGLNISKNIIEQMGGTIGFISEPGQGTIFYFELPIAIKAAA